jgi:hypothetical protein
MVLQPAALVERAALVLEDALRLEAINEVLVVGGSTGGPQAGLGRSGQCVGVALTRGVVPGLAGVAEAGHGRSLLVEGLTIVYTSDIRLCGNLDYHI